jgi:hypothetical protein
MNFAVTDEIVVVCILRVFGLVDVDGKIESKLEILGSDEKIGFLIF